MDNEINHSFMFIIQYNKRSRMRLYKGRETINFYFDCPLPSYGMFIFLFMNVIRFKDH